MTLEIIAEAAQGYAGDPLARSLTLVDCAAAATADVVKFQLVYADELCTPDYVHFDLFRSLEMPDGDWRQIADRSRSRGIRFYVDVFGPRSLDLACRLCADGVKLHSTDVFNHELIRQIASAPIARVVLSAGGALDAEVDQALALLIGKQVVVMHGFQGYPTEHQDNHLSRITTLRARYPQHTIGFADHVPEGRSERFWLSAIALGAGATVLEKHLTRAVVLRDEDYESALNPDDFALYCANMRLAFAAVGADITGMSASERTYREKMKKQVVAARPSDAGTVLDASALTLKRTSATEGVLRDLREVQGRRLRRRVEAGTAIRAEDLE